MLEITGRVIFNSLEGGFWGIVGDDSHNYCPLNLPKSFQEDGLRVKAKLERVQVLSLTMWGSSVRVIEMELLG